MHLEISGPLQIEAALYIMYGLLIKHEVKMAPYWPSSYIACL